MHTQTVTRLNNCERNVPHDGVIKWKHFPRYWPFVRGIHRSTVNSPHKWQWRETLIFSLSCAWTNSWANKGDAGDLRRHRAHCDVILIKRVINSNKHKAGSWKCLFINLFYFTNVIEHVYFPWYLMLGTLAGKIIEYVLIYEIYLKSEVVQ